MSTSLSLLDLKPKDSSFDVSIHAEDRVEPHTFHLRPFTLADEVWMAEHYPNHEELVAAFQNIDMHTISHVAYNQLTVEGKKFLFDNIRVMDVDDKGKEFDKAATGHQKLMYAVSGHENQLAIYVALMEARGISVPNTVEEAAGIKKTNPAKHSRKTKTGLSWLTHWLRNMAGR